MRIGDRAGGRDNNFNLIRMLAATGVLVSHAWPLSLGMGTPEPLEALFGESLGRISVFVFFAISGFFITRSFDTRRAPLAFAKARALRLFPALAVVLVLTVLVCALVFTTAAPAVYWAAVPDYLLRNLTLFQLRFDLPGVFEDTPYGPVINGSLWTLSYEVTCYLGVFLAGLAGLIWRPRLMGPALVAVIGLCAAIAVFEPNVPGRVRQLATLALPFALGTAFWLWRSWVPLSWPLALGLVLVAVLLRSTALWPPLLVLALSYAVFVLGYTRIPGLAAYRRLGDYSYGMYVYAFPIQQICAWAGARDPLVNIAMALPPTLICAVLSWHFVEEPALRLLRKAPGVPGAALRKAR